MPNNVPKVVEDIFVKYTGVLELKFPSARLAQIPRALPILAPSARGPSACIDSPKFITLSESNDYGEAALDLLDQFPKPTKEAATLALQLAVRAQEDLQTCDDAYKREHFAKAAENLQQGVEKTLKAFGLLIGTLKPTSKELKEVSHESYKALIIHFWEFYSSLIKIILSLAAVQWDKEMDHFLIRRFAKRMETATEALKNVVPPDEKLREELSELSELDPAEMWKLTLELDESNKWVKTAMEGIRQPPIISSGVVASMTLASGLLSGIGKMDERTKKRVNLVFSLGEASQKSLSLALLTAWHIEPARYPPTGRDYWQPEAYMKSKPFVKAIPTLSKLSSEMVHAAKEASQIALEIGE
jgi:hypothetical protein